MTAAPGVTDMHVHVQPWEQLKPGVMDAMRKGKEDHWERLLALMADPFGHGFCFVQFLGRGYDEIAESG